MRNMRTLTVGVVMALGLLLGTTGCNNKEESSGAMSEQELDIAVETTTVTTTSFPRKRAYVGNVSAAKQVKVIQTAGDDVYDSKVENISFFKAVKPAPTKADLIGTWEAKEMPDYDYYGIKFTENEMTLTERNKYGEKRTQTTTASYTWNDGVITLKYPATDWSEAYEETDTVSFLYDKSVLLLKSNPWEDESIEQAEVWFREGKTPDTSDAKLDGKWFAYHRGHKDERYDGAGRVDHPDPHATPATVHTDPPS